MIFYFSRTDNSTAIAKGIAAGVENEQINFIPEMLKRHI
ncbi:MAG: hypothetical protein K0R18_2817 [Bacillales bacterium]|jgi:flavodoxin|nr:hypothetical protein [Bacillales bacterium]